MLKTETNTQTMERRVLRAAGLIPRVRRRDLSATFEHGQWWVTDRRTGAQWSVCDATGRRSIDGFCFEMVTPGDED